MKFANSVNSLVVKFIRLDFAAAHQWGMLVKETIYPIDYRSYEIEKRELWLDVFEDELKQLYHPGFCAQAY